MTQDAPPSLDLDTLVREATAADERDDWKLGLQLFGAAIYLHVDEQSYCAFERCSFGRPPYSEAERRQLDDRVEAGDAEATFLVAYMLRHGIGGYSRNFTRAFRLFCAASSLGHVHATHQAATLLQYGEGVPKDDAAARRLFKRAADAGCAQACAYLGRQCAYALGGPADLHLAALYFRRAVRLGYCAAHTGLFPDLTRDHSMQVAPWSRWVPDAEVHSLVPPQVHRAMRTWTLVAKRSPLFKDLHLIVTRYISTRSGW